MAAGISTSTFYYTPAPFLPSFLPATSLLPVLSLPPPLLGVTLPVSQRRVRTRGARDEGADGGLSQTTLVRNILSITCK